MAITTIARTSTKKISAIKDQTARYICHDLDHGFVGYDTDGTYAWKALAEGRAKLATNSRGGWTIRLHSNCWFELIAR